MATKLRGKATVLPPWWREKLQGCWGRLYERERWSMQRLADELTELADRRLDGEPHPWDRKTVERFLDNKNPTEELVEAFCLLFPDDLIPPTYVARSPDEANALAAIARGFDAVPSNPEIDNRKAALVDVREAIEQRAEDQTRALDSVDESRKEVRGTSGRRRGGVARGRAPTS